MPICSILGCGNGEYALNKWKSKLCPVHPTSKQGTEPCNCKPPFRLFPFPLEKKNPEARKMWIKLVNRKEASGKNWQPKIFSRVCSIHFPDGQPTVTNPHPTLNLPYNTPSHAVPRKPPKQRLLSKPPDKNVFPEHVDESSTVTQREPGANNPVAVNIHPEYDHPYALPSTDCENCVKLHKILNKTAAENLILQSKLNMQQHKSRNRESHYLQFINSDEKVRQHTGLRNKAAFDDLYTHLMPKLKKIRYWIGCKRIVSAKAVRKFKQTPQKFGRKRQLTGKQEFLIVLLKLRLGLTNVFLCSLFSIRKALCSQILNTWIKFLARELKPLIYWPDKSIIKKLLPIQLRSKYPSLRCTLDCTEIFIARPRHMLLQNLTWSDYKKHNTVKYLIGIAPNGMVSFLSDGWGGRTSDKHIVNHSGFLDLVELGDVILADRGFTINAELLCRGAKLHIPPPSSGWDQQTPASVAKKKKIANARIHVERAIGRIKWFGFLRGTVPINHIPILDDIVLVCAALCNLLQPLVS